MVPFPPNGPCPCSCQRSCPSAVCPPTPQCLQPPLRKLKRRARLVAARSKREISSDPSAIQFIDTNCNSEQLRQIIIEKADKVTSISKRQIQEEAEAKMGGRYNVICARGDFSYITNTEMFCQQTVGDVTCYAFKQ
ncbi:hypothetical protein PFISCL1PPCAC_8701, partial [Pristionchus fissidentatus]